jgi:hypothetical protein
MSKFPPLSLALFMPGLVSGCLAEAGSIESPTGTSQSAVTYLESGSVLSATGFLQQVSGRGLNGTDLNGRILEGSHVAHVVLGSASWQGTPMSSVSLEDSALRGRVGSKVLANANFVGVDFEAWTDRGEQVRLRVDKARRWLEPGMVDTFLHTVTYETTEGSLPLCGTDAAGNDVEAIALNGRWDYREGVQGGGSWVDDPQTFTFACMGHVAAKCVEMGYKPWRKALVCHAGQGCRLEPIGHLHRACTRLLRADYCGDGTSHTSDGIEVNVYDGYGIRIDSEDWNIEAEWSADGAVCLERTRLDDPGNLPCAASLVRPDCGDPSRFVLDTALISEILP